MHVVLSSHAIDKTETSLGTSGQESYEHYTVLCLICETSVFLALERYCLMHLHHSIRECTELAGTFRSHLIQLPAVSRGILH